MMEQDLTDSVYFTSTGPHRIYESGPGFSRHDEPLGERHRCQLRELYRGSIQIDITVEMGILSQT